jgi:hypothetical protein
MATPRASGTSKATGRKTASRPGPFSPWGSGPGSSDRQGRWGAGSSGSTSAGSPLFEILITSSKGNPSSGKGNAEHGGVHRHLDEWGENEVALPGADEADAVGPRLLDGEHHPELANRTP